MTTFASGQHTTTACMLGKQVDNNENMYGHDGRDDMNAFIRKQQTKNWNIKYKESTTWNKY